MIWRHLYKWTNSGKKLNRRLFSFCVPKDTVPAKAFEFNKFKRKRVEILLFDKLCGFKEKLREEAIAFSKMLRYLCGQIIISSFTLNMCIYLKSGQSELSAWRCKGNSLLYRKRIPLHAAYFLACVYKWFCCFCTWQHSKSILWKWE